MTSTYRVDATKALTGGSPGLTPPAAAAAHWGKWLLTQCQAIWIYLKNLVLPHVHSFFGPWYDQFTEGRPLWRVWSGPVAVILVLGLLTFLWLWWRRRRSLKAELPLAALAFLLPTLALSLVPRVDWYHPARQMLGSMLCLALVVRWLATLGRRQVVGILAISSLSATLVNVTLHYSSEENFYAFESLTNGGRPHPWVSISHGRRLLLEGSIDAAVQEFSEVTANLKEVGFQQDQRTGLFWSLGHYYAWLAHEKAGRKESSLAALAELMRSSYFPSTLACLQDERASLNFCLTPGRVEIFCDYFGSRAIPPLPQIRKMRRNPCLKGGS